MARGGRALPGCAVDRHLSRDQALQAAGQAKKAVEQNAMVLQQKIAERSKLLSQLEQAKTGATRPAKLHTERRRA